LAWPQVVSTRAEASSGGADSIGERESRFFSNLVTGKQMLLKMGDQKRYETVLAAAPAMCGRQQGRVHELNPPQQMPPP
jgi:hypothetical protein